MAFSPGQIIVHRNTRRSQIAFARPVRVVSDDERGLLLWMERGTPSVDEVTVDGRRCRGMPFSEWAASEFKLVDGGWKGPGILLFFPPGADHSVWWFWDDTDWQFQCWYVNLEDRAVRWDDGEVAGIDVVDQDLDVVIAPDHTWQWKDEDEFAERLAHPDLYWVPDESAVWAEGRRVIKIAEAAEFPFDGTWTDFRPDPSWAVPESMPSGWDRPVIDRS